MKKNVYDIIQDWHELLNQGVITKEEFDSKKNELLNEENIDLNKEKIINNPLESKVSVNGTKNKSFTKTHFIIIGLGIICIGLASLYYFNYYKNDSYYINIVKNYISSEWEKSINNPIEDQEKVTNVRSVDGQLIIDSENFPLSVYDFKYSNVLHGDLNNDEIPETIITNVENQGGGAGGNVVLNENYIIKKNKNDIYDISEIQWELIDPPKNEFGYDYWIDEIKNGYIIIKIAFYKEDELNYPQSPQGEQIKLNCKLIFNQLKVIE
jgi:hypothetical protein